ncbi:phage late control D family protein [Photobacterium galatheae]|uniref:Uncharacterized protein n=1 Tax=Photobacterium galatheae TaxID=1654360 RepID=A0A066RVH1_9GAMM|nr:contractile injection system protein, VgrG/Pvc8 family [Photobacterium galatheae]KDM91388.1 hypothetical protein EA58_12575 [Photobacterium galatheae]MCM0151647.1 hypothetical protein [Photobacterium galatheae]
MGLANYKIVANGKDITDIIRPLFVSLTITDEAGRNSDSFSLTLVDDGKIAFPKTEAQLQIATGKQEGRLYDRGTYTVNSVKLVSPANLIILSGDAANLSGEFKNQRDFTWENISLRSLVETVASRCGYQPAVSEVYSDIHIEHRLQTGQSDADLLTELANEHNATMKVAKGKLIFFPRGDNQTVSGKTLPAVPLHLTDEVKAEITLSGAGKYQAVIAKWHDGDAAETKTVRVGDSKGKAKQLNTPYPDEASAKAAAESALYESQRAEYKLEISDSPFIPGLQAERNILLSGHLRPQFNGAWMCESVTETLDQDGHVQSASFVVPKGKLIEIPRLN